MNKTITTIKPGEIESVMTPDTDRRAGPLV